MFTFLIALPWLVIIAVVLVGIVINLINSDRVFRHYENKHGRK